VFHRYRGEVQQVQELVEAVIAISQEQRFPAFLAQATILQGWVLARQGQGEEGIMQMRQGLTALQATGTDVFRPHHFASLVEAYGQIGQAGAGLAVIEEMLAEVDRNGNRFYEAELYRLKGELLLKKPEVRSQKSEARPQSLISNTQHQTPSTQAEAEAEACFLKAIEVTRKQQAKSLELRATVSLARLWQQQGKKAEAHQMLFEIYNWFTEGFDTKALQEAKALLEELG
jgi:predicted ATPase